MTLGKRISGSAPPALDSEVSPGSDAASPLLAVEGSGVCETRLANRGVSKRRPPTRLVRPRTSFPEDIVDALAGAPVKARSTQPRRSKAWRRVRRKDAIAASCVAAAASTRISAASVSPKPACGPRRWRRPRCPRLSHRHRASGRRHPAEAGRHPASGSPSRRPHRARRAPRSREAWPQPAFGSCRPRPAVTSTGADGITRKNQLMVLHPQDGALSPATGMGNAPHVPYVELRPASAENVISCAG